jgi:hypothetical protein
MRLRERALQIANEDISFQSDAFFRELAALFRELEGIEPAKMADQEAALQLPAVIAHYTGMNVKVVWGEDGPSVTPPLVTKNHVLLNRWADHIRQRIFSNVDGDRIIAESRTLPVGRVDRRNARVSGVFSELAATLYLPVRIFLIKLTADEVAALVLHELGHVFVYFELISHTLTTNQILAGLSKKLDQSSGIKDREAVLVKVKSLAELKELDAQLLARSNDRKVVEMVVITSIARELQSELGMPRFDMNSFETLADQFAVRMGAGRELVTAQDRINKAARHVRYRGMLAWFFADVLRVIQLVSVPFAPGCDMWPFLMIAWSVDPVSASDDETAAYGSLKARYERIREQMVEGLKNADLDKDAASAYAEDLKVVDDILATVRDRRDLFACVADFLSPSRRRRGSQEQLQRELERIANNDLFVKAAALRQAAI